MLTKYLDPKNDIAFKIIFGSEKNKSILIHFINDILGFTASSAIIDVEFLATIQNPEIASKKQSIVDVLCKDANGVSYIVEMQVAKSKGFEKRAQYYASKVYSAQANKGERYHSLKEVIFIAIANCEIFPNKLSYKSDHIILDKDSYEHNLKDFYFTFIELPKFNKKKGDHLDNIVEKWCYFFKYADETSEKDLESIIGSDLIIKQAYQALDKFNWTEVELSAYEATLKRDLDEEAVLEQKIDDAKAEGKAEGIAKGKREQSLEIARNLLKEGMDANSIAKIASLSLEEIIKLKHDGE